jgi:cytochrome P450
MHNFDKQQNTNMLSIGITLLVNLFNLHRRKDIWGPNADDFQPSRFQSSNDTCHQSFWPFSSGPRNCLGKSYAMFAIKITLSKLIRNFKFSTDLKYEELKFKTDIHLKICQSLTVKLQKRNYNK